MARVTQTPTTLLTIMDTTQHKFSEVPSIHIPRSLFNRPFNLKTTIGTDYLYPIYCDEALPGDTFKFNASFFGRLTTPVVPIMDNLYLDTFFFAVPIRLIDKNFAKLMGERPFGDTTTEYTVPQLNSGDGVSVGSLSDYIGIPINVANLSFSAYWHRSYSLIFNEWFRDENLVEPVPVAGVHYDGTVTTEALSDYTLLKRGKRHDAFTSCLPWPQKGDPVSISLGQFAPLTGAVDLSASFASAWSEAGQNIKRTMYAVNSGNSKSISSFGAYHNLDNDTGSTTKAFNFLGVDFDADPGEAMVDLTDVSAITINQFREAYALQSLCELDARGGSRLIEIVRAHFGIVSPDLRAMRPEYLGGFSQRLNVTSVPQTSATDSTSPQGNLSAYVQVGANAQWIKSFTEHCVILGLANIRADLSYSQGLPRMFSRKTRYDFYWPSLANLGETFVANREIYSQGDSVTDSDGNIIDDLPFGYQERWYEYRYHPNMITGLFRPTASNNLAYWHLSQKFDSLPLLNSDFIQESVPISRVLAVQDEPPFILDAYFDVQCARPMPLYSVPSIGNHL